MRKINFKEVFSKKMVLFLFQGFSSGLPLLLVGSTLKLWLARENVAITTIGYFGWVGLAYSFKLLWAPFLDRYELTRLGRRRSWMLLAQAGIIGGLVAMSLTDPHTQLTALALIAAFVAFCSATQDIAIDAYRREACSVQEIGLASSMTTYGYRIAMLMAGGVGVGLVGSDMWPISWGQMYQLMALFGFVGVVTAFLSPKEEAFSVPKNLKEAVVDPFVEFLKRKDSLTILFFVFSYKLGDALGASLLSPYYVETGFSNADIAFITKIVGLSVTFVGMFVGGLLVAKIGVFHSLWFVGILQVLATAGFSILQWTGPQKWALALTVIFEDVSQGMGTVAFVTFMALLSNKKFTATQYAILSSVSVAGVRLLGGFTGDVVKSVGWTNYFFLCAAIGIPGTLILYKLRNYQFEEASSVQK